MKINLNFDDKNLKNRVLNLRQELDKTLKSGILDEDFEDRLKLLESEENLLLEKLVPYFREYGNKKIKINMTDIEERGIYNLENFLYSYAKINENLYILNSIDMETRFFYIFEKSEFEIEYSDKIKKLKNHRFTKIIKYKEDELLLFSVKGNVFSLKLNIDNKLPNTFTDIEIKELDVNFKNINFGNILYLGDDNFIAESNSSICLGKYSDSSFNLEKRYLKINDLKDLVKIDKNIFIAAKLDGELIKIKVEKNKLGVLNRIQTNHILRKIKLLENEDKNFEKLAILGNNGIFIILDKDTLKVISREKLDGNLFDISTNSGTAIILSEDGNLYVFEENFNKWNLKITLEDVFYTNIINFNEKNYLILNLDGKFERLNIDRVFSKDDLKNIALY